MCLKHWTLDVRWSGGWSQRLGSVSDFVCHCCVFSLSHLEVGVCVFVSHITSQVFPGTTAGRALRSFFLLEPPTRIPFQPLFKNPSRTSQLWERLFSPQEDQRLQKVVGSSHLKAFLSQRPAIVYPRWCGWTWRGREPGRFVPLQRSSWERRGASWERGEPSVRTMSNLLDQYCGSVFWVSPKDWKSWPMQNMPLGFIT